MSKLQRKNVSLSDFGTRQKQIIGIRDKAVDEIQKINRDRQDSAAERKLKGIHAKNAAADHIGRLAQSWENDIYENSAYESMIDGEIELAAKYLKNAVI